LENSLQVFIHTKKSLLKGKKVKWSHYRPGVTQRVGRGIALLFHDCDTRRGWMVSSMPRPHSTPGKDPVPILREAGWAPGPVWMGGKSCPHRDLIPDRPARSQSLYQLSYTAHKKSPLLSIMHHYSKDSHKLYLKQEGIITKPSCYCALFVYQMRCIQSL